MSDKNFKVKSGLQVPSLTTAGPVTTDSSGNVTSSSTLPIAQGGTGQTTAANALNALLPLQTGNTNRYLQTNGVTTQWNPVTQQTVTDALAGTSIYTGTTAPTSPTTGDIWVDNTTGNGIQLVRWRKTITSTTSTISGLDDNNLTLSYTAGNEQVYINGTLVTRGQDYTATNGTSISLTQGVEIGDTVEIFGNPLFSVTDTYTQSQADSRYVGFSGFNVTGKNLIINGGFDIWQRGVSFSTALYTADRWFQYGNDTITRQSFTAASPEIPNGLYYLRYQATQNGAYHYIQQNIENGHNDLSGRTITISFWARSNTGSNNSFSVLTALNNDSQLYSANFTLTPTWTRYYATFTIPQLNYAATYRYLRMGGIGDNGGIDLAQVQLEIGSVVTPFSRAGGDIQGEFAKCQRYYYQLDSYTADTNYSTGVVYNSTSAFAPLLFNKMRTIPTISSTGTFELIVGGTVTAATIGFGDISAHSAQVNIACTGMTTGQACVLRNGSTSSTISISAEL